MIESSFSNKTFVSPKTNIFNVDHDLEHLELTTGFTLREFIIAIGITTLICAAVSFIIIVKILFKTGKSVYGRNQLL